MFKKCRKLILFSVVFLMLFGFSCIVKADMGSKPSITIYLTNIGTIDYTIDLFEQRDGDYNDEEKPDFAHVAEERRNNS